ncbi:hypothetical protein K438DRAFT_1771325 [Mycena galopus ATCC 62051]|nr:hypothetical protein K438DRAFT_1771325 [Mycena galopus ATCC 62051]
MQYDQKRSHDPAEPRSKVQCIKKMKKHRYRNIHNVGLGRGQREKRRDGGKRQDAEMFPKRLDLAYQHFYWDGTPIPKPGPGLNQMSMQLLDKVYSPHRPSRASQDILIVPHPRSGHNSFYVGEMYRTQ